jgi:ADP-ribosylarginine hydrolase
MNNKIKNNINASLCIGSYLDTLGFKNSLWEFNFGNKLESLQKGIIVMSEIIHNYYSLGGNKIDISTWKASDDTIMMIATKKAVDNGGKDKDYEKEYLKILPELNKKIRGAGLSTITSLNKLKRNTEIKYDKFMGGNGAAMRTAYIGLKYYEESDIDKLIHQSIYSSRLTHNYTMGFLGGFVTALFCAFALRGIDPFKWAILLIDHISKVDNYMKNTDIYDLYQKDKDKFWDLWHKFIEEKLNFYEHKSTEFLFGADRYNNLLKYEPAITKENYDYSKFGASGIGAVIFAYDALLMSYNFKNKEYNFDNLVYYSTLHFGDNDSTGIIAGNWYGAYVGFKDFDQDKIDMLEFKKDLI